MKLQNESAMIPGIEVTAQEAAKLVGLNYSTIYRWIRNKWIPHRIAKPKNELVIAIPILNRAIEARNKYGRDRWFMKVKFSKAELDLVEPHSIGTPAVYQQVVPGEVVEIGEATISRRLGTIAKTLSKKGDTKLAAEVALIACETM